MPDLCHIVIYTYTSLIYIMRIFQPIYICVHIFYMLATIISEISRLSYCKSNKNTKHKIMQKI